MADQATDLTGEDAAFAALLDQEFTEEQFTELAELAGLAQNEDLLQAAEVQAVETDEGMPALTEEQGTTVGEAGPGEEFDDDDDGMLPAEEDGPADGGAAGDQKPEDTEPGLGVSTVSAKDVLEEQRNQRIMAAMSEAQLDRYEAYRRSALPRPKMKKLLAQLLGSNVSVGTLIALCGIGKMFVGDLVELARHTAAAEGHTGPLLPTHVRRAYQVLDAAERVPHSPGSKRRMFK